jgi:hypothetical protein
MSTSSRGPNSCSSDSSNSCPSISQLPVASTVDSVV